MGLCVPPMRCNECGVNAALLATFSCIVITFIACCVTILCRAKLGIRWNVAFGSGSVSTVVDATIAGRIRDDLRSPCAVVVVSLARRVIIGNSPGVLFLVTRRCIRGFSFSLRFAVGFRDCIIGGASVMRGMVSIGVLSNTLCWFSLATLCSSSLTLCSSWTKLGFNACSIFLCSDFMSLLPAVVAFASSTASVNSSVSARKC
jgi:hypothetical protein